MRTGHTKRPLAEEYVATDAAAIAFQRGGFSGAIPTRLRKTSEAVAANCISVHWRRKGTASTRVEVSKRAITPASKLMSRRSRLETAVSRKRVAHSSIHVAT